MNQKEIRSLCERLGIEPIPDIQIPSEKEFEKMFNSCGCHIYDDAWEKSIAYSNFKSGYMLCEIKKHIK